MSALDLHRTRARFTLDHYRLRRARRLFVSLNHRVIEDLTTLEMVAEAMQAGDLYAPDTNLRDISYSIARALYRRYFEAGRRCSGPSLEHWWGWMVRFRFCGEQHYERAMRRDHRLAEAARKYPFNPLPWQQ